MSEKQIQAATGSASGTGTDAGGNEAPVTPGQLASGGTTATTAATAAGGTAGAASPTGGATAAAKPGATGAAASSGGSGAAGAGGSTATTAAAGDNGGATDKGVTANSITFANIATLTGPVPGLFAGAVNGTQAFFAYQNSQGGVNGRQLKLQVGDDRFDCGTNKALADQYQSNVFGFVGSFSLFDNCSAQVLTQHSDVPDIHNALSRDAQAEPNNFAAAPIKPGMSQGVINWIKSKFPDGVGAVGSLVGNVQSAKDSWVGQKQVMEAAGFNFVYERDYNPTETDFTADIVQMRTKGVKLVIEIAADVKAMARIESAAQQQNWKPQAFIGGSSVYDAQFLPLAGSAAEGTLIYNQLAMYLGEDKGTIPEVALMNQWVNKVRPGASLDLFTAYGWASARLLVQALQAAGPKVTRAGVIGALKNIHKFDSNGLMAQTDPGAKQPASCFIILQVQGGKFARYDSPPTGFRCDAPYAFAKT